MIDLHNARRQLHEDLGYKPLHKMWAKAEILLGLLGAGSGILLMLRWACQKEVVITMASWEPFVPCAGLVLFILGWYLALAGHRSHLYQSLNEHTAYLLEQIRRITKS